MKVRVRGVSAGRLTSPMRWHAPSLLSPAALGGILLPWVRTVAHKNGSAPPPLPRSERSVPKSNAKAVAEAQKIVAVWNARQAGGRELWFYPTIGAAIRAGLPWLSFLCPACGQVGSVDLRTLDRHPRASISSLIPSVSADCVRPMRRSLGSKC